MHEGGAVPDVDIVPESESDGAAALGEDGEADSVRRSRG